jgi:hypothetical protein
VTAPRLGPKDKLVGRDALIQARVAPEMSAGLPLAVIFVFPDEPMALAVAKLTDGLVRGRLDSLEDCQTAGPHPGRRRMVFCAERDEVELIWPSICHP